MEAGTSGLVTDHDWWNAEVSDEQRSHAVPMTDGTRHPEAWLRGPIDVVPALLQPVAHALTQAVHEVTEVMHGFDDTRLWDKPFGSASVGFHLQHLAGVIDRLTTYARGESLSPLQLDALRREGSDDVAVRSGELVATFAARVGITLDMLRAIDPGTLTDVRSVGRAGLPSTVIGLLAHSAEHSMRHVGQLLVTVRAVTAATGGAGATAPAQDV